ncbi:MAG: ATPase [Salinivirgaceae bacterium]|nr:ATPase [Salinivirgaceae bacterium]
MKKIFAIPTTNGVLDGHFGHCHEFTFIEVENDEIGASTIHTPPPHEPGVLPKWIASQGATDVIAGGMGQSAINIFNQNKVNVFVGAPKLKPNELVTAFLSKALTLNENYCDH